MNIALLGILLIFIGCSQKNIVGPNQPVVPTSALVHDLSFLKECSQIRAVNPTLWLLTCQRAPHIERTEIYEWSLESQKLKRLTFQDGQIWDIAPVDFNRFYYSSSYDEFKEQFASILSGAKPGSDIYVKNRTQSEYERVTNQKGLEISLFWHAPKNLLYFVYETDAQSKIMTLNSKHEMQTIYSVKNKYVRNPVYMDQSRTLYWMEYDAPEKGAVIRSMNKTKKQTSLYKSDSKVFQLSAAAKSEQLLIGFSTGKGIEIWNLNLTDSCWKLAYKIAEPASEFYAMNDKVLFLTIKNSLKQDNFFDLGEVCHSSPPNLGVSAL